MKRFVVAVVIATAGIGVAYAEAPRQQPRTGPLPAAAAAAARTDAAGQNLPLSPPPSWGRAHAEQYSTANGG